MSLADVSQWVVLGLVVVVGALIVYAVLEMRQIYREQQQHFVRLASSLDKLQKLQPDFLSALRHIESDGRALQDVAIQIQDAVAGLNNGMTAAIMSSAERQADLISDFREHLDRKEESPPAQRSLPPRPDDSQHYVRIPRVLFEQNPQLRLAFLRNWLSSNRLAVLRRAANPDAAAGDLISGIPDYLHAVAELMGRETLLVGTYGLTERINFPLKDDETNLDNDHTDLFVGAE